METNKIKICTEVDYSKPILDLLLESIEKFMTNLVENIPETYYVSVVIGNDNPEVISLPIGKIFGGKVEEIRLFD